MKSTTTITTVVEAEDPEKSSLINLLVRCQPFVAEAATAANPNTLQSQEASTLNLDILPVIFPSVMQALVDTRRRASQPSAAVRNGLHEEIEHSNAMVVKNIVAQSRIIREWQQRITPEEFVACFKDDYPYTLNTARNLATLCTNSAICNPDNWGKLPTVITTLAKLALIQPDILDSLIRAGRVNMTTISETAIALIAEFRPKQDALKL